MLLLILVFAQEENGDTSRRVINAATSDNLSTVTEKLNGAPGKSSGSGSTPVSASKLSAPISTEHDEMKR